MIEVQNLTKHYGRVTAVDDVSFRVERGEILGFLGPNGAGKTTTMRILTGYMPATDRHAPWSPATTSSSSRSKPSGAPATCPRPRRSTRR